MEHAYNKGKILLVDDEEDIRDVLEISLTDSGYEVLTAENGEEALKKFKEINPPVVLTDIKMPSMDGIELLRRIKYENPETEIIMITGHGDMELAIESLKHEATDFITKPINIDALEIALKRAYEKIVVRQKLREYTENLENLVREKTELQDHLSSLGLMIGSISHGIKGILTGLDGGMYILNSGLTKQNQKDIKEGWEIVQLMVERIRKMVLDILLYAKERDLKWEQVDLLDFASDVALGFNPRIQGHDIEFIRDFDPSIGKLEIDPGFVHSALINILENAVDACLKDESGRKHQIGFSVKEDRDNIIFNISDNGVGMDDETKEKIFNLFFSSKGRKGTGLGLFLSNKIIQQHGGKISVSSEYGKGSTFSIKIPKMIPDSARKTPARNKDEVINS